MYVQLPLTLLRAAQNRPMMVELKSGETYSGLLASCDGFMNLHLKDSVCTSKDGERFWKLSECYIRGNMVKYIRLQDEVLETAKDDKKDARDKPRVRGRGGRGGGARGFGGRGRGGADRGRGGR
ncbi:LSM domain-containing protein [Toxoplasma gondii CAST]|uniref:U6 snRNA-associated Sm-like protein LSm4 n=1 Tax=Toxoplasma gondii CAST TaxID=943122 RepID=A0A3R8ANB8_TOXGO|nr:LSM domain-containing protein [Toxoplasma gondii CAST]